MRKGPSEQQKTYVMRQKMPVGRTFEALAHEVPQVTEEDNQDVTDIGGQEDIVRRVLLRHAWNRVLVVVL